MGFNFIIQNLCLSQPSQMQIGVLTLMTEDLLEATASFLDPILSPGHLRNKMLFLDHQLSQNIGP